MDQRPSLFRGRSLSSHRELLATIGGTVVVMALAIGFFIFLQNFKTDPIPSSVRTGANYPLYWATFVPPGFTPASPSYQKTGNTIRLTLKNSSGKTIDLDQIAAPSDNNPFASFNQPVSSASTSPLGVIYDLSFNGSYRFGVYTNRSIVFISSSNTVITPQIAKQVVDGLKPAR